MFSKNRAGEVKEIEMDRQIVVGVLYSSGPLFNHPTYKGIKMESSISLLIIITKVC